MVVKLNYRGVLITAKQYRIIANDINNKNFIHFNLPSKKEDISHYLDKFWFRLGYSNSINIIVANASSDILTRLIYSGLIVDLRDTELPKSEGGVYDRFQELTYGRNTRVKLCSDIRNTLAKLSPHRWCGAELESIFHPDIYINATEICGNNPPGEFFRITTGLEGIIPVPMHEKHLSDLYQYVEKLNLDDGQKKLGLIMCAIPSLGYNIIYVGGSPGIAWMRILSKREFKGKIIAIDPFPMDLENFENLDIDYFPKMIRRAEDLEELLVRNGYTEESNYIFIWDVRCDGFSDMSQEMRRDIIAVEVITLTNIITSNWFSECVKMYQIKVNTRNIDLYSFPRDGKLYVQPYTLSKDVYELRCVGFVSSSGITLHTLSDQQIEGLCAYLSRLIDEISNGLSEYRLFLNFMYRECDFIEEKSLVETNNIKLFLCDFVCFSLVWVPTKVLKEFNLV